MRALEATGRQVEALDAYRRLRYRLVEELGIDPSQELQDLEYRILSQTMPARTSSPVRSTLPVLPSMFIGRERDLEVTTSAVGRTRIVTITGPAGVGKTRLVIEAASRVGDQFPDGVFFVDLATVSQSEDVPEAVSAGLSIHDHSARPPEDVVADRLRAGRLLLV
jgi:MoxR-like ATPase